MKRLLLILAVFMTFTAIGQVKPSQMSAATVAAYKAKLGYETKTEAEAKYLQIVDTEPATNNFYTKELTDSLAIGAKQSRLLIDLKAMGNDVVSVPYGAITYGTVGSALTSARDYGVMHVVLDTIVVTGVEYGQSAISPNFFARLAYNGFDLCRYSAGVITQITQTASDSTIFKTYGYFRKAFPAPITLNPGIYYVRAKWQASTIVTAPALTLCNSASIADMTTILGTQALTSFYKSSQTTFATPFTLSSGFGGSLPVALNLYYTAP